MGFKAKPWSVPTLMMDPGGDRFQAVKRNQRNDCADNGSTLFSVVLGNNEKGFVKVAPIPLAQDSGPAEF